MAARRKRSGAPLSATFVRTVREPGRYGDGRGGYGLSILVKVQRNGRLSKTWSQRYRDPVTGKIRMIGLGAYPRVTLAEARKLALHNRREIDRGRDPRGGGVPTFEAATEAATVLPSVLAASGWSVRRRRSVLGE